MTVFKAFVIILGSIIGFGLGGTAVGYTLGILAQPTTGASFHRAIGLDSTRLRWELASA